MLEKQARCPGHFFRDPSVFGTAETSDALQSQGEHQHGAEQRPPDVQVQWLQQGAEPCHLLRRTRPQSPC